MADPSNHLLRRNHWWLRHPKNPVLPPGPEGGPDSRCCMNPFVLRVDDTYHLYYGGADAEGFRRICLATAPVDDPSNWTRLGAVLDHGEDGSFDFRWTVLPHVVRFPDRWHLYYTANCGHGEGLSAFPGIGLAFSNDGKTFTKHEHNPVLAPTGVEGDPDCQGIAGGSVIHARLPDGSTEWRYYYTGCPTLGDDLFRNQQKVCCYAVSQDGIQWEKKGGILFRDPDHDYVNVAAAGPVVRQEADGSYRMWYSAIGTRWGAYSIAYAESDDGLTWRRGEHYGNDLQLGPNRCAWEWQMVEYPAVIAEKGHERLFYCGNGYGQTGIGTAVSSPLRATAVKGPCLARVVAAATGSSWNYRLPEAVGCDEGVFKVHAHPVVDWHGPTADGMIWHEWETNDEDYAAIAAYPEAEEFGLTFIQGLHYRVLINHSELGLELTITVKNLSDRVWHNVHAFPSLGRPSPDFEDPDMERTFIVTDAGLTPLRDTDRGSGDPVRTHYPVRDRAPVRFFAPPFWGEPSATAAVNGAILRANAAGTHTIGTAFENVCELFHNEDAHHCIHSVPTLGDVAPRETRTVKGRIVFVEGGPEKALDRLALT